MSPMKIRRQVLMLFSHGYALQTVLLWVIFFCSLMNLFLFGYWLPEVLHLTGMSPPRRACLRACGIWVRSSPSSTSAS